MLGLCGVLQTIPSLALLAILISLLGTIGTGPALIALSLYALLPVVRNTCTGLLQVPSGIRSAAVALGMQRRDTLLLIELPLALPIILAGIKTAAIMSVGTATIAAFIGAGGYGERIAVGLALNDRQMLLAGALFPQRYWHWRRRGCSREWNTWCGVDGRGCRAFMAVDSIGQSAAKPNIRSRQI